MNSLVQIRENPKIQLQISVRTSKEPKYQIPQLFFIYLFKFSQKHLKQISVFRYSHYTHLDLKR